MTKKQQEVVNLANKLAEMGDECGIGVEIKLSVPKSKSKEAKTCESKNCCWVEGKHVNEIHSICGEHLKKLSKKDQKKFAHKSLLEEIMKEIFK